VDEPSTRSVDLGRLLKSCGAAAIATAPRAINAVIDATGSTADLTVAMGSFLN